MRQPERSASSTRRTPSTPTKPFSVGKPPRRATRNSLSQRLSQLVRSAGSPAGRALRADFPGVAIPVERSKLLARDANLRLFEEAGYWSPGRWSRTLPQAQALIPENVVLTRIRSCVRGGNGKVHDAGIRSRRSRGALRNDHKVISRARCGSSGDA